MPEFNNIRRFGNEQKMHDTMMYQIRSLINSTYLRDYDNEKQLLIELINNGTNSGLQISPYVRLSKDLINSLTKDIIRFEIRNINGEEVVVPVAYLANKGKGSVIAKKGNIEGKVIDLAIRNLNIGNNSGLAASESLKLNVAENINNRGALGDVNGSMQINNGGVFTTTGVLKGTSGTINAGQFNSYSEVERQQLPGGYQDIITSQSALEFGGKIDITSNIKGALKGTIVKAAELGIYGEGVDLMAQELEGRREQKGKRSWHRLDTVNYQINDIQADFTSNTTDSLRSQGTKFHSKVDINSAVGDTLFEAVKDTTNLTTFKKKKGIFKDSKRSSYTYSEKVIGNEFLGSSDDIKIHGKSDIISEASNFQATGTASITSQEGAVRFVTINQATESGFTSNHNNRVRAKLKSNINHNENLVENKFANGFSLASTTAVNLQVAAASTLPSWVGLYNSNLEITQNHPNSWNYSKQKRALAPEMAILGGIATGVMTAGLAAGAGLAAATALGVEGTTLGIGVGNATAATLSGTLSSLTTNTIHNKFDFGKGANATFNKSGVKSIAVSGLTAGVTGGVTSTMGVNIDTTTLQPIRASDATDRIKYASINTLSQTATEVGILGSAPGKALVRNLRSNVGTQVQALGASSIGASYLNHELSYPAHKGAHAILGGTATAIAGGDILAGALGATTAEAVGEAAFKLGVSSEASTNIAKVAGATSGLATGDVASASNSANTAVENNLIPLMIGISAYVLLTGEGNARKGVETIGAGEDFISKGIAKAMEKGVELSYEHYPNETMAVLNKLTEVGQEVGAIIKYVDKQTGQTVSANWNKLSTEDKNLIKGSGVILSVLIPASTKAFKVPKKAGTAVRTNVASPNTINAINLTDIDIVTSKEANKLPGINRGLIFVEETSTGKPHSVAFQDGTSGAMNSIQTKKSVVPALRYDNPQGRNFIKFDGFEALPSGEITLLIDAKTTLPFWNKKAMDSVGYTIDRIEKALKQNPGYKVVYEFPDTKTAAKAQEFIGKINKKDIISVRVRGK